ncbi:MAG: hypothetical protein ACK4V6_09575 [Microthrixaceae bacterium]
MKQAFRRVVASIGLALAVSVGLGGVNVAELSAAPVADVNAAATVTPGAFCAPAGAIGYTKNNVKMTCTTTATDSRNRWREVVK